MIFIILLTLYSIFLPFVIYSQAGFGRSAQKQCCQIVKFVIFEDMQKGLPVVL